MANHGFTMSAAGIWKVANVTGDWSESQRAICFQASALAELPDATAKALFVAHLNTLSIKKVQAAQAVNKRIEVEVYSASDVTVTKLTDIDMRKKIAEKFFPELGVDGYKQLSSTTGVALQAMYESTKPKGESVPFRLYRIFVNAGLVVYRITNDDVTIESVARQAVKVLVDGRKLPEVEWKSELP